MLTYSIADGITAFSTGRNDLLHFKVVQAHQVHSDRVMEVTSPDTTREELDGIDALITDIPGVAIGARTADCVPILLYDPVSKAIAAVHSGWRGTVLRISDVTLRAMRSRYGTSPEDVLAVIGPSIGPDSFQVGREVVSAFADAGFPVEDMVKECGAPVPGFMKGGLHVDLWQANRWILESCGVQEQNITMTGIDTYTCEDFFSARREGPHCGRIINVIRIDKTAS